MFRRWTWRGDDKQSLFSLQEILASWQKDLNVGPIPGERVALWVGIDRGAALAVGNANEVELPAECRPIGVSYTTLGGQLTFKLEDDSGAILESNLQATATPQVENTASTFKDQRISGGLRCEVVSIDSGTPTLLSVTVWLTDMGGFGNT